MLQKIAVPRMFPGAIQSTSGVNNRSYTPGISIQPWIGWELDCPAWLCNNVHKSGLVSINSVVVIQLHKLESMIASS